MESEIKIEGMSCGHCVSTVRAALLKVPGVREARVEVGKAIVLADPSTPRDALTAAVAAAGYHALV